MSSKKVTDFTNLLKVSVYRLTIITVFSNQRKYQAYSGRGSICCNTVHTFRGGKHGVFRDVQVEHSAVVTCGRVSTDKGSRFTHRGP